MIRDIHCWWCGHPATVDPELPEDAGMVRDTGTSWLCVDNDACVERALNSRFRDIATKSGTGEDALPHDPRRTEFDVMSDARGQACPHCHAKPFWSCTWLCADPGAHEGQLHKERVALVPPAGAVPAIGYECVPAPGSEDREG